MAFGSPTGTEDPRRLVPPAELLAKENRELAILNTIATELNESVDLSSSLSTVLSRVAGFLGLGTGWVLLLDGTTGAPYLAAAQNLPPGLAADPARMEGSCHCLETFRTGDLTGSANVNVVTCSRLGGLEEGTGGLSFHASIPLHAGEKKLGVMNVASPEWRRLTRDELRILHTIGDMLGIAIERAGLVAGSQEAGALEERNRLAREIHDTLAQGLSATALQLETAEALLEDGADPARVREAIRRALETTRLNLQEARRSVLDLRAAPLEGHSLAEAISELCTLLASGTPGGPRVEFSAVGAERPVPSRVESALYRIAQEALSNALQHARATRIEVELVAEPEQIRLYISDDGRGFEVCRRRDGHFGLIGMRERVKLLGGEFHVCSRPGHGTVVDARIPLE
jgi:two-component system, NarL family, sensor kinase